MFQAVCSVVEVQKQITVLCRMDLCNIMYGFLCVTGDIHVIRVTCLVCCRRTLARLAEGGSTVRVLVIGPRSSHCSTRGAVDNQTQPQPCLPVSFCPHRS